MSSNRDPKPKIQFEPWMRRDVGVIPSAWGGFSQVRLEAFNKRTGWAFFKASFTVETPTLGRLEVWRVGFFNPVGIKQFSGQCSEVVGLDAE